MTIKVVIQSKETAKDGIPLFLDLGAVPEIIVNEPSHFGIVEQGTSDGKLTCFLLGEFDGKVCAFKMTQNIFDGLVQSFEGARKRFNV